MDIEFANADLIIISEGIFLTFATLSTNTIIETIVYGKFIIVNFLSNLIDL